MTPEEKLAALEARKSALTPEQKLAKLQERQTQISTGEHPINVATLVREPSSTQLDQLNVPLPAAQRTGPISPEAKLLMMQQKQPVARVRGTGMELANYNQNTVREVLQPGPTPLTPPERLMMAGKNVINKAINKLQDNSAYAVREMLAPNTERKTLKEVWDSGWRPKTPEDVAAMEAKLASINQPQTEGENLARVLGTKVYASFNPFIPAGMLERHPATGRAMDYINTAGETAGPLLGAATFTGAEVLPSLLIPGAQAETMTSKLAGLSLKEAAPVLLKEAAKGTVMVASQNALFAAGGAPEGQRPEAALAGATDWRNFILGPSGSLLGGLKSLDGKFPSEVTFHASESLGLTPKPMNVLEGADRSLFAKRGKKAEPLFEGMAVETPQGTVPLGPPEKLAKGAKKNVIVHQFSLGDEVYVEIGKNQPMRDAEGALVMGPENKVTGETRPENIAKGLQRGNTLSYTEATVVGHSKNGNLRVRLAGTDTIISVPKKRKVNLIKQTATADAPIRPDETAPMPKALPEEFDAASPTLDFLNKNWDKARNLALPPSTRATDLAGALSMADASRRVMAISLDANLQAAERAMKGLNPLRRGYDPRSDFDRALSSHLTTDPFKAQTDVAQTTAALAGAFPNEWAKVGNLVSSLLEDREKTFGEIQQRMSTGWRVGGEPLKKVVTDAYAARLLATRMMGPKAYKRLLPDRLIGEADRFFQDAFNKSGRAIDKAEARAHTEALLNSPDPLAMFEKGGEFADLKVKPTKVIRDQLLGEVHSGMHRLAQSQAVGKSILMMLRAADEIAANPNHFSLGPRDGFVRLPDDSRLGNLRGGYAHPDVHEMLVNLPQAIDDTPTVFGNIVGHFKGNVYGARFSSVFPEMLSNMESMVKAGVPLYKPASITLHLTKAMNAWLEYYKNPAGTSAAHRLVQEALEDGAAHPGHGLGESMLMKQKIARSLEKQLRTAETSANGNAWRLMSGIHQAFMHPFKSVGRLTGDISGALSMQQQVFQLATYSYMREKLAPKAARYALLDAAPFGDSALHGRVKYEVQRLGAQAGATLAARREAARRIQMSFVSAEHLGSGVRGFLDKTQLGRAPFLSSFISDALNWSRIPKRLSEEAELRWSLLGSAAVLGGLGALMNEYRRLGGPSDEQVAASKILQRDYQAQYKPNTLVGVDLDEKGRVVLVDISRSNLAGRLAQGDPDDPMWAKVASNLVTAPVQGGPFEAPVQEQVNNILPLTPQRPFPTVRPWERGPLKLLWDLQRSGFLLPATVNDVYEGGRKAGYWGVPSKRQENITDGQFMSGQMGVAHLPLPSVSATGQKSPQAISKIQDIKAEIRDFAGALRSAHQQLNEAKRSGNVRQQHLAEDAIRGAMDELQKRVVKMKNNTAAAQMLKEIQQVRMQLPMTAEEKLRVLQARQKTEKK